MVVNHSGAVCELEERPGGIEPPRGEFCCGGDSGAGMPLLPPGFALPMRNMGDLLADGSVEIWDAQVLEARPGVPSSLVNQTWATRLTQPFATRRSKFTLQ